MLGAAYAQVCHRLAQIRADDSALASGAHIHLWQQIHPITTEALVQLTQGCPQVIYYGGMLNARLRYYDDHRHRPGLPDGTAALVDTIKPGRTAVTLVNLNPSESRSVIVQAGGLAEHRFNTASYDTSTTPFPGATGAYAAEPLDIHTHTTKINDTRVRIVLPPATTIRLDFEMDRYVNRPRYV